MPTVFARLISVVQFAASVFSSCLFGVSLSSAFVTAFHGTTIAGELRGRAVDADSEAALPCRLYVQSADGKWWFAKSADPHGSAIVYDVQRGPANFEKHVTLSAHPFTVEIPVGNVTLTAEYGKEYRPLSITVDASQAETVTLPLKRWIDMPSRGWFSGDTHVHRKLEDVPNVMQAEDLHVALPLTYWVRDAYVPADQGGLAGRPKPELIEVARQRVIWPINTEYELFKVNGKAHTQGAVFVLNHKQPLTLATPPVAPLGKAAHEAGAILDLDKHSWNWSLMIVPLMDVDLFELANNHVWRTEFAFKKWTIDVVPQEWGIETDAEGMTEWGWIDFGFKTYYALLNCGFRMRPTGGTASGVHPVPLGFGRVYVQVLGDFSYDKWMQGLNAGRSFVTTGPMLLVEFNGRTAGTVFQDAAARTIHVTGTAESRVPLERIEFIINGEVARTVQPANTPTDATGFRSVIDEKFSIANSAWLAVRCFERQPDGRLRYAHTAPIHCEIDGPVRPHRREVAYFIQRMEQEIARNRGVLADDEVAEYEQALAIYREIARRASD